MAGNRRNEIPAITIFQKTNSSSDYLTTDILLVYTWLSIVNLIR
jgi:hypothetical protein